MNSDQLDLWQSEVAALPWGGQSPRALTKVGLGLFSRHKPPKDERFFSDPCQLELFSEGVGGPPVRYRGAPLLLSLEREGR